MNKRFVRFLNVTKFEANRKLGVNKVVIAVVVFLMIASSFAILTVVSPNASAATALSVTVTSSQNPTDVGYSATLTADATGGVTPYTYLWYWANGTATNNRNDNFVLTESTAGTYGMYVKVTDDDGSGVSVDSSTYNEVFNALPTVSASASQTTVDVGQSFTLTATASKGTTPYSYVWFWANNGTPISGATSSTYTTSLSATGTYYYEVKVTDAIGASADSNEIIITGDPALTVSITASTSTIDYGQSVTFTASASGGSGSYSYQWYLNGSAVSGATSSTWTTTSLPTGSPTIYVDVTDSNSRTVQSNTITETVHPVISVTISSSSNPSDVNTSVTFTATATGGSGTYTNYAFYLNSALEQSGSSDTWSYTFTSIGNYTISVTVTDSLNDQGVADMTQTVSPAPLTASISASLNPVDVGVTVTFDSFVSGGTPPYTYQWYINGAAVSGATGSTFSYAFSSPGSYLIGLRVADSSGDPVTAKQSKYPAIMISSTTGTPGESSTPQANVGENFSLNLGYLNDFSGDSYQWYLNGTRIPGATSPTYTTSEEYSGNYTFTLLIRTGSVTLTGRITEKVTQKIPSYSIEFIESGLPVGAKWNVQIHQGNADWLFQDNMVVNYNQSGQGLPAAIFSPSLMSAFPPGTSFALNGLNGSWEFFVNYGWHNRSLTIINGTYMTNVTRGNVTLPSVAANGIVIIRISFTLVANQQSRLTNSSTTNASNSTANLTGNSTSGNDIRILSNTSIHSSTNNSTILPIQSTILPKNNTSLISPIMRFPVYLIVLLISAGLVAGILLDTRLRRKFAYLLSLR